MLKVILNYAVRFKIIFPHNVIKTILVIGKIKMDLATLRLLEQVISTPDSELKNQIADLSHEKSNQPMTDLVGPEIEAEPGFKELKSEPDRSTAIP